MSRERELFELVVKGLDRDPLYRRWLKEKILVYLASEKQEMQGPLRDEEILNLYVSGIVFEKTFFAAFKAGYRMAEKHHGIEG